jgi:hypothetical protein
MSQPALASIYFPFENLDFRLTSLGAMQSQSSIPIKDTDNRCAVELDVVASVSAGKFIDAVE